MIWHLVRYLCGWVKVRVKKGAIEGVLTKMGKAGIRYEDLHLDGEEAVFVLSYGEKGRFLALFGEEGEQFSLEEGGFPCVLRRYRRRWGLAVGGVLFCLLILRAGGTIWRIEVEGNREMTDSQVIELLASVGFSVGDYAPEKDFWEISAMALAKEKGLAFLSVNVKGSVAYVSVMEAKEKEEGNFGSMEGNVSNLVAARDGVIERFEIRSGEGMVKVGEVVREGELLVSGVVTKKVHGGEGYYLTRSAGQVFARTMHKVQVCVERYEERERYTEAIEIEKQLNFFGFELKFSKKGGNLSPSYVIIEEREQWVLFEDSRRVSPIPLPIFTTRRLATKVTSERYEKSDAEMETQLGVAFASCMEEEFSHADVLSIEKEIVREEETWVLTAYVECIEDIAKEAPISLPAP